MHASRIVNMGDPDAPLHFVRDISDGLNGSWRWAQQRPALKIGVRSDENLKYTIDFTLPAVTFKETGPVTMTYTVNGHVLDRVHYTESGAQHFEKPVPAEWLTPGQDAMVGAEIDKVWTSKEDGARLGFILTRMGLTP
jgi:hypothetical protein